MRRVPGDHYPNLYGCGDEHGWRGSGRKSEHDNADDREAPSYPECSDEAPECLPGQVHLGGIYKPVSSLTVVGGLGFEILRGGIARGINDAFQFR